jgi:hypothetical protein
MYVKSLPPPQLTSPPARSRQPQKTTLPFLKVSEENSVEPGPNQLTKAPLVSWLGPTFTQKRPRNVQKMKNAVFDLAANFFPYTFLLATPSCPEFQPLKVGVPIYKGRLPLQMSTVLQTKCCLNYSVNRIGG